MIKLLVVVGTRPEIIRLSSLIPKLEQYFDVIFVHTGQNNHPQLNEVFFEDLNLRAPDFYLNVPTASVFSTVAGVLTGIETLILDEKPDATLILGDTNSALAAIVSERCGVPVYHMEAGNRSFDRNVPEELNRKLVDHVATFNLPYNTYSYNNLIREGLHPRFLHITGSPIKEVFEANRQRISSSNVLERMGLEDGDFVLASLHRQENVDSQDRLLSSLTALNSLGDELQKSVILSTHPRTSAAIGQADFKREFKRIKFCEPLGYLDYCKLQMASLGVVSDSGTISEESAVMGFIGISFRDSIERPEALDSGNTVLSGVSVEGLRQSFNLAMTSPVKSLTEGYGVSDFSDRVTKFVASTVSQFRFWTGLR